MFHSQNVSGSAVGLSVAQAYRTKIGAIRICNMVRLLGLINRMIFHSTYNSNADLLHILSYQSQSDGFWRFAAPFSFSRSS